MESENYWLRVPSLKTNPWNKADLFLFGVVVKSIRENQKRGRPKANKNSKSLSVSTLGICNHIPSAWSAELATRGKPDQNRTNDRKKAQCETKITQKLHLLFIHSLKLNFSCFPSSPFFTGKPHIRHHYASPQSSRRFSPPH